MKEIKEFLKTFFVINKAKNIKVITGFTILCFVISFLMIILFMWASTEKFQFFLSLWYSILATLIISVLFTFAFFGSSLLNDETSDDETLKDK